MSKIGDVLDAGQWLTTQQVMEKLGVSRQTVHSLAAEYSWESQLVDGSRYYLASHVESTPDAAERRRLGYKKRSLAQGIPQEFYVDAHLGCGLFTASSYAEAKNKARAKLGGPIKICRLAQQSDLPIFGKGSK